MPDYEGQYYELALMDSMALHRILVMKDIILRIWMFVH